MAALLGAVEPVAHGVEVQDDLARVFGQAPDPQFQQAGFDLGRIVGDFMRAGLLVVGQLQPVERGGAGQGHAPVLRPDPIHSQRVAFVARNGQQRIQPQPRMVIEIFIPQGQAIEPLIQELFDGVIHPLRLAVVVEAGRQTAGQAQPAVDLAQQEHAGIHGEMPAGKVGLYAAGAQILKQKGLLSGRHVSSL